MATFLSGHQRIFWDLLFTSGFWGSIGRINPEEHTITIVSPWITDISENSGWPEELAKQACSTTRDMNSLTQVLSEMARMGFRIRLVTLSTQGKWMSKSNNRMLKNEFDLMEKMQYQGAKCQIRNDMHFKWLCTPAGIWKGSSNATANGIFGRLEEQNDVFLEYSEPIDYNYQKRIMQQATKFSADYFDGSVDISESEISLHYGTVESGVDATSEQSTSEFPPHDSLEIGDYPPFVPSGFLPVGQIDAESEMPIDETERKSMAAWVNQCILRLCSFIDFAFTSGSGRLQAEGHGNWLGSVYVKKLDGAVFPLSESDKTTVENDIESKTSHEEIFRIRDKFHILQCCGITVNEDGRFTSSDGMDARGKDLKSVFVNTSLEFSSISTVVAERRIERLFSLVNTLVNLTCFLAQSEDIPRYISSDLSQCILEIEDVFLSPIEDHY